MDQPCERCGTFAVLESNGFRALCGPCWKLARHPIEFSEPSLAGMSSNWVRLIIEFGGASLLLLLIEIIPPVAIAWAGEPSAWFSFGWSWLAGSATEVVILANVAERALGGRRDWGNVWRRARQRYFPVLALNVFEQGGGLLGLILLCVPGVVFTAFVSAAIPIVVFEGLSPIRAAQASFRRAKPMVWQLVFFSTALIFFSLTPVLVSGALTGWAAGVGQPLSPELERTLRVGIIVFGAAFKMPSVLFQVVAWSATRPPQTDLVSAAASR